MILGYICKGDEGFQGSCIAGLEDGGDLRAYIYI